MFARNSIHATWKFFREFVNVFYKRNDFRKPQIVVK